MHIFQTATREEDGTVVATGEQMLLHVDTKAGRACPAEPAMRDRLPAIAAAQAEPAEAGRRRPACRGAEAGMNFGLTPEQAMVVATVRSFVENELYPLEAEVERTGQVPAEVGREITTQGAGARLLRRRTSRRSSAAAGSIT